jgi:hypothetical protein
VFWISATSSTNCISERISSSLAPAWTVASYRKSAPGAPSAPNTALATTSTSVTAMPRRAASRWMSFT